MNSFTKDEHGNNLWTVLLLRPDHIASDFGRDTWLSHVTADTAKDAEGIACKEAATADHNIHPDDYYVLFVCRGHLFNLAT